MLIRQKAMAAWTGLGCFFAAPTVSWRLCLSLQIVAPLLLLAGSPWLPESPRWYVTDHPFRHGTYSCFGEDADHTLLSTRLIAHNKEREGLEVLQKLHVRKGDVSDIPAKEEYYQIRKQIELENQTGVTSMLGMLKRASYRKRMLCGLLVQYAVLSPIGLVHLLILCSGLQRNRPESLSLTTTKCSSTTTWVYTDGFHFFFVSHPVTTSRESSSANPTGILQTASTPPGPPFSTGSTPSSSTKSAANLSSSSDLLGASS